jgi:hypothetical protein
MSNCTQCGSSTPAGQSICSMCYGDIAHGNDGYYEEWARHQEQLDYLKSQAYEEFTQQSEHGENGRVSSQDAIQSPHQ